MKAVKLELEKIIEYFSEMENENDTRAWEEGTDFGVEEAYKDAKEKCEKLMEVIVSEYPEQEDNNAITLEEATKLSEGAGVEGFQEW